MPPFSATTVASLICSGVSKLGMPTSRWIRSAPAAISLAAFSYMPKLLGELELMRVAGHFMAPQLAQPFRKRYGVRTTGRAASMTFLESMATPLDWADEVLDAK